MVARCLSILLLAWLVAACGHGHEHPHAGAHASDAAPAPGLAPPGYMVVISIDVDASRMGAYARATVPLLLQYGGRLLFVSEEGQAEVLEGEDHPASIRVFEFPSLQHARDFYYSETYQQQAIPLRAGNGRLQVLVSDAFVPDPRWALQGAQ